MFRLPLDAALNAPLLAPLSPRSDSRYNCWNWRSEAIAALPRSNLARSQCALR